MPGAPRRPALAPAGGASSQQGACWQGSGARGGALRGLARGSERPLAGLPSGVEAPPQDNPDATKAAAGVNGALPAGVPRAPIRRWEGKFSRQVALESTPYFPAAVSRGTSVSPGDATPSLDAAGPRRGPAAQAARLWEAAPWGAPEGADGRAREGPRGGTHSRGGGTAHCRGLASAGAAWGRPRYVHGCGPGSLEAAAWGHLGASPGLAPMPGVPGARRVLIPQLPGVGPPTCPPFMRARPRGVRCWQATTSSWHGGHGALHPAVRAHGHRRAMA